MEELGDFIRHKYRENQQKKTHAETAEVFPETPEAQKKNYIEKHTEGNNAIVSEDCLKLSELHLHHTKRSGNHCCCRYLLRDAPRARMMGSVISIMDCRVEVTTMKRMMLRRKVRCSACISKRPV